MKQVITAVVASMFAVSAFASTPAPAAGAAAPAKCDPAKDKNCKAEAPKK
jgi:Spy/CpxP family protein refolding chaperone